jgi:hypothetical protein
VKAKLKAVAQPALVKLDLGCGKAKREGFLGVDARAFEGVDQVVDLRKPWPWKDGAVEEAHCSHFVEHLTAAERIHFVNELYRVLIPGAKCQVIVPHWASCRAYGDLTHQWPPVSEFWFYYLDKGWRTQNAPHNDFYTCDFNITWGYSLHADIQLKNAEHQQYAAQFYKEAVQDIIATFTKR